MRNQRQEIPENETGAEQEPAQESAPAAAAAPSPAATATETSSETVGILYTPTRRRAAAQRASSAIAESSSSASTSKKRKAKKDKDDDDDDDDDWDFSPGPSRRAQPGRTRVLFCQKCKSRFARPANATPDIELDSLCPSCLAGNTVKPQKKSPAKKRRLLQGSSDYSQVPSLQDICIEV